MLVGVRWCGHRCPLVGRLSLRRPSCLDAGGRSWSACRSRFDLVLRTVMAGGSDAGKQDMSRGRAQCAAEQSRAARREHRLPRRHRRGWRRAGDVDSPSGPRPTGRGRTISCFSGTIRRTPSSIGQPFSLAHEGSGFTISRRMTDSDSRFTGVVVLGIPLAFFHDQFSTPATSEARIGCTLLRWRQRVVLMRMPFDVRAIGHPIEPHAAVRGLRAAEPPP